MNYLNFLLGSIVVVIGIIGLVVILAGIVFVFGGFKEREEP